MVRCRYCGGFLRWWHSQCRQANRLAREKIPAFFASYLTSSVLPLRFRELATAIARAHYVDDAEFHRLTILGLGKMIDAALADHLLTEEEEQKIRLLCEAFEVSSEELNAAGFQQRLVKAMILRELDQGTVKAHVLIQGPMPINLGKEEKIVWMPDNVDYYRLTSETHYVGRSSSTSFRVIPGLRIRVSGSPGRRVRTSRMARDDRGQMVITNKALYFLGRGRRFRIALSSIVSVQAFSSSGIEIFRKSSNPTPERFTVDDPSFVANVILKLGGV